MIDSSTAPWAALLLRVSMGVMFIAHALLKYIVFTLPGTVQYFVSIGYPGWVAYAVLAAEFFGGAMLVLGIYPRWVALALVPEMLGAAAQHIGNGWVFDSKGGGWEFPLFWAAALIVQFLLGDGAWALTSRRRAAG